MLLQDLKVIELSTWVAGPGCAMILAEWGADVIKVETTAGDPTRTRIAEPAETNPIFSFNNRGKRSLVLDVRHPQGRDVLLRMLETADIFVTNVRPGALRRAGLAYHDVRHRCPRLIYGMVSGYGLQGDAADKPAFDQTAFFARGGVLAATLPPDQEPFPFRPGFGDTVTALAMASGILAAVHDRTRTGQGQLVEASLIRTGIYTIGWDVSIQLRYGEVKTAERRADRRGPMVGYFHTKDDRWIYVGQRAEGCLPEFLKVLGLDKLCDLAELAETSTDLTPTRQLRMEIDRAFAYMTLEEAGARLDAADIIWAPLARLPEVVEDPYATAAGCFVETPDGRGSTFPAAATPVRFSSGATLPRRPSPRLGQHTSEVLREFGIPEASKTELLQSGVAYQDEERGAATVKPLT